MERTLVVGAGIFGVTAAIELRKRGHAVRLVDPGPLPHPLAASTDISKVVRLEYGADEPYTALAERAIEGWRRWNRDRRPLPARSSRTASRWFHAAAIGPSWSMAPRCGCDFPPGMQSNIAMAPTIPKAASSKAGKRSRASSPKHGGSAWSCARA